MQQQIKYYVLQRSQVATDYSYSTVNSTQNNLQC